MPVPKSRNNLISAIDFDEPVAIIMGSEDEGVSPEYLKLCDERAMIPMTGTIASLNVSAATAIILYEVVEGRAGLFSIL